MAKVASAVLGAVILLFVLAAAGAGGMLSAFGSSSTQPSSAAITDIPGDYLGLYMNAAATCPGLEWSVLAAIGKVESDHGRSPLPGVRNGTNDAGARGPMQFLLSTFRSVVAKHPPPEGGANPPSPYDPHDAVYAAAAYLCDAGARDGKDLPGAIKAYNHADWYVADVLAQAQTYESSEGFGANTAPSSAAREAINYAEGQLGLPYEWGGNGPGTGDTGFDCSGLTKAAYAAAGISLPRTAQEQFDAGPQVPSGQLLRAGDLVFYGRPNGGIHHVGLYVGDGQMIDAPRPGKPIRIEPYRYRGDDYAGATRPADRRP
ncbi:NlpC/P60 family protein [Streptomyces sp. NPDC088794]|uniref:C40 family peptidase n=1 Tax=Streptomyces sp. NPDC088794 TaxID=3365902 RepID=UPI0037F9DBF2